VSKKDIKQFGNIKSLKNV